MKGPAKLVHVSARLSPEVIARLDAMAVALSPEGVTLSRSDAVRVAVASGLEALERHRKRAPKPRKGGPR